MSQNNIITTIDQIASHARDQKIAHLATQDDQLNANYITINDKKCVNFGSCSYLGLEFNDHLKNQAKKAIENYGTQFSASRAYISIKHYTELENKLESIFGSPTVVTPTTTLGHIAAIPTLVSTNDLVILDHQVHNSVQTAVSIIKSKGAKVELVRHNRMDLLEQKIKANQSKYNKIWYMADGIYSMYGDFAPLEEIYNLLDKYENFHFYVDDAHGMSCFGNKGQGFVLSSKKIHDRMIVATSFAKAFATGGGALIFPNREKADLVRKCGGPMITSGPMQPANLGAAIACADLHLSGKIEDYQEDLNQNIMYTNMIIKRLNLPNLAEKNSPIFFIGVSLPKIAYELIRRLKKDGHFLNIGIFPAVPMKNTGVRFTITRLHTFEQIENMLKSLAYHLNNILEEENISISSIYRAFKIKTNKEHLINNQIAEIIDPPSLEITHFKTIKEVNKDLWNEYMVNNNMYDWTTMKMLEDVFTNNERKENNWKFDYIIIKENDKTILCTYSTTSINKDDMLMPKEVSCEIERMRQNNQYYLTSKVVSIGCPISEGNHLYLDKTSKNWQKALNHLLSILERLQSEYKANKIFLRDLPSNDSNMDDFLLNNGLFKINLPQNCVLNSITWDSEDELYKGLSKNSKRHYRKNIIKSRKHFDIRVESKLNYSELKNMYQLYLNVKSKSLDINTFTLPFELFEKINDNPNWEILSLYLNEETDKNPKRKSVAIAVCHKNEKSYSFVFAGLDYSYNGEFSSYRQLLAQILIRGRKLGYNSVRLGYTSVIEKRRFGASMVDSSGYLQTRDNYNLEVLQTISINKNREDGVIERRVLPV